VPPGGAGTRPAGPAVVPPGDLGLRDDVPLPIGTVVDLEDDTQEIADGVLFGGSPARVLRLSAAGVAALAELRAGPVTSVAAAVLARRLTDTGLAQPRTARPSFRREAPVAAVPAGAEPAAAEPGLAAAPPLAVTVVVPVRDRAAELDRCLAAAGHRYRVVVVDDGSADPAALAAACAARGAELVRREVNGGPAAARNTGLRVVGTEFVAFLDSDCVPAGDWIGDLAGHFADPLVAAVAPRIVAAPAARPAPAGDRGSVLDLGDRAARVAPMTRVAYVPTAALLVRRAALGDGFDEALRYGEDVDLVWRLIAAGWRVRYDPGVRIGHAEPASRPELLRRRFEYGRSAAPLTRRHPGAVAPLVLQPWPTITMAALLARRPVTAAAAFGVSTALLAARLRDNDLPATGLVAPMANGVRQTWLGTGRWCGQFAAPVLLLALARPGGRAARTRWGRRLAAASLLAGPPLTEWAAQRDASGGPGPVRFTARALADQAAYGAGVYAGCLRERMISPVLPAVSVKPFEGLRRRRVPR
jgi:mycofactocin system glycosyltransferase